SYPADPALKEHHLQIWEPIEYAAKRQRTPDLAESLHLNQYSGSRGAGRAGQEILANMEAQRHAGPSDCIPQWVHLRIVVKDRLAVDVIPRPDRNHQDMRPKFLN